MLNVNIVADINTTAVKMRLLMCVGVALLLISSSVMAKDEKEEKKDEKKDKENMGTVIGIDLGTTYSWWVKSIYMY